MSILPLFATCARGVEPLLAAELQQFGGTATHERPGGVAFQGELAAAYRACLWSRLASRVLMPLAHFPLADADALYAAARQVDWLGLFDPARTFAIEVAGHSPAVTHTHYAGLKVKDAIADAFREKTGARPSVDTDAPDLRVHLHLEREAATLSLDLSGDALHRRGYREVSVEAPLKENLAAAILIRAGWPALAAQGAPIFDPMCGSGTLVLEAALMAADIAPAIARKRFGFEAWLGHRPELWDELRTEAGDRREQGLARLAPVFFGADNDPRSLKAARANGARAGLAAFLDWREGDATQARPPGERAGLIVVNPPYGERLGAESEVIKLYSLLGANLKQHFGGWHASVFTARPDLSPRLGLRARKMYALFNGALPCKLLNFDIPVPAIGTVAAGGEDFANRLAKNIKHLSKWARRKGVSCYRLYDADLPEYAVAVDIYPSESLHVHVQEYAAPDTVDPVRAERRLREALAQIGQQLEVPADRMHFRQRKAQKRAAQYEKQDETRRFHVVEEHGCRLQVNFDDYLDTGLFLDHRPLRLRLQQEAAGKRFLNLFCYTGAASVHAARGGAVQTLSVDLSNTYLEWAQRNLRLNGFEATLQARPERAPEEVAARAPLKFRRDPWNGASTRRREGRPRDPATPPAGAHVLLRADCLAWLGAQAGRDAPAQFDLIFLDPPTFSTSKKMEGVLDVQRDHATLIGNCAKLLAPGGTLYFSSNRRGFKLDAAALANLAALEAKDITAQTLDEDFKRPPPTHRCWQIRHAVQAALPADATGLSHAHAILRD